MTRALLWRALLLFVSMRGVSAAGSLLAYPRGQPHGNRISHAEAFRRMRSVHPSTNVTFDSIPVAPSTPGDDANYTRVYVQADGQYGTAHILHNPSKEHFAILEPRDGCGGNRRRVSETAAASGCLAATNAGFFNTSTGDCLGSLVSEGHVVQNTGWMNANFGLRGDGRLVAGYIPAQDVHAYDALVAGVLWIVRGGEVYVDQSLKVENLTVQESGNDFATLISARTAIGFDPHGHLIVLQVEGKSYQRGVSLYDMARLMIDLGVVSAVNLDGGGSATSVIGGSVVSQPSDECGAVGRVTQHCERSVTSIVCMR